MKLKHRIAIILALIAGSLWTLYPRTVVERVKRDGVFVYDTVQRVPLKRGLDLVGGIHMALEIDESKSTVADKAAALTNALTVLRNRVDEFGVAEPVVQQQGSDRIIVELPGIDDPERAQDIVQKSAFLEFQITDESDALTKALPRLDGVIRSRGLGAPAAARPADTAARTPAGLGSLLQRDTSDTSRTAGDTTARDTAVAAAPGTAGALSSLLQQGSIPGEYMVASENIGAVEHYLSLPDVQAALPPGKVVRWSSDSVVVANATYRALYVLDARPIITGQYITDAQPNQDPTEGTLVTFELNNEGGRQFRRETGRHLQDYMAIVLDQRVMGRPPVIQGAIGTRGQITMGGQGLAAAQDLALVLRAGALPVPLKIVESGTIGASLGQDAVEQGIRAGVLGLALVILIMVVYYKLSGVFAVGGLVVYTLITLAVLAMFGAVLTLPGIAGFVLSIGMALDANFLIFERTREEMDAGKSPRAAIDEGFSNAWSAIIDTHVTTALTAAILYQFGTGPVQGFAVALLAGIAASFVSAIFVVRTLFLIWLHRTGGVKPVSI
ncbi:MAG TPA: protein translocase subunit SecD [Gemmatimonadaceae bacterium]|nr:protein translocase subunit SecD [Gemmatimonadaceae bacterium]